MNTFSNLLITAAQQAALSLLHNWPYLLAGIIISALLKLYVDADKISGFLKRFRGLGILAATGAAVATPLCSCGTTAVILGMMASTISWAPIVAFMVSSPLTSPQELLYSAGLFGWPFALAFFAASILLGLAGGAAAAFLESRGWLANQVRFNAPSKTQPELASIHPTKPAQLTDSNLVHLEILQPVSACACAAETEAIAIPVLTLPHSTFNTVSTRKALDDLAAFLRELAASGKQLLPMFVGFAFIGYLINGLIPASWVASVFGGGNIYSVPLAATAGLPFYINSEGSLPLVRALIDHGMSYGAALAFLIAGSGTSLGAIAGALTIARWRVVGLVIIILWIGAVFSGYAFDLLAYLF